MTNSFSENWFSKDYITGEIIIPTKNRRCTDAVLRDKIWGYNDLAQSPMTREYFDSVYKMLLPKPSVKKLNISFYENSHKYERDIRSVIKPGRFLLKFYAGMAELFAIEFTDWWANTYVDPVYEGFYHESFEASAFRHAFTKLSKQTNFNYSDDIKSAKNSCMRYNPRHFTDCHAEKNVHPSEAYASGDFKICYLTEKESSTSKVMARSVVSVKKGPYYNPIYACSYRAAAKLRAHVENSNPSISRTPNNGFDGLKLKTIILKHLKSGLKVVAPFVDGGYHFSVHEGDIIMCPSRRGDGYSPGTGGQINIHGEHEVEEIISKMKEQQ